MQVTLYDSFTRKKQPLLVDGQDTVSLYVCGPTVYQRIHIGNARTFAMFGLFARYLRSIGLKVTHVTNITDVNDKIYSAAAGAGVSSTKLADDATRWYFEDTDRLGIGRPNIEPRVSESIDGIIKLIQDLVDAGAAYQSGGDVYFSVASYAQYGRLSNQNVEELQAGSRADLDEGEHKREAADFVLWKAAKPSDDTSWPSPWGDGRPGWHIECSAMAEQYLGPKFDVHGGGLDLIFPHHENEVAQSRASGRDFARIWMHGGLLEFGDTGKMSKSVGNVVSLKEVLDAWPSHVVLLLFMGASYRNPLVFSDTALEEAQSAGTRITESLRRSERYLSSVETRNAGDPTHADPNPGWEGIHEALRDDFNTAGALGELYGLVYDLNTAVNEHATPQIVRNLRAAIDRFLVVFALEELRPAPVDLTDEVRTLLSDREEARRKKDFEASDRIRDELKAMGYVVRDTADGSDVIHSDGDDDEEEVEVAIGESSS